jgi:fatty-acyl-CoA synthase
MPEIRTTYPDALSPVHTLSELLRIQASTRPDQPFAIFPDDCITYGALAQRATRMAKGLIALGVKPGDHVGILIPNHLHFLVAHYAVQMAGARGILFNARFKQVELEYLIPFSDIRILITTDAIDPHVNFADILTACFPALVDATSTAPLALPGAPALERVVLMGEKRWPAALSEDDVATLGADVEDATLNAARATPQPEDVAVMIFTSGTTAMPKTCMLSHAGLIRGWRIYAGHVRFQPGEKMWGPMPFFHSGGIGLITLMSEVGGTMLTSPHYDPEVLIQMIRAHRVEHLYPGFHTLSLPLLTHPGYERGAFGFIRSMVNVGPLGTQQTLQDLLPEGAPIMNLFGMSESSGLMFLADPDAPKALRHAGAGTPPPGVELRLVNPETGKECAQGERGEIWFRGGGAFLGYYKNSKATAEAITPEGWVRTGDIGEIDSHGWLYYIGRIKDMLKVGGENVAAAEIESFLSSHPAVRFVQVIGIPDDRMGEVPVAFIELNPGKSLDLEGVEAFCKGRIASFKIPRQIHMVTEWPMSATKVQKFKLRDLLPKA